MADSSISIGGPGSLDLRRRLRNLYPQWSDEQLKAAVARMAPPTETPKSRYYDELGDYHAAKRSADPLPHPKPPGYVENIQMPSRSIQQRPRTIEDLRAAPADQRAPLIPPGDKPDDFSPPQSRPYQNRSMEERITEIGGSGRAEIDNGPAGFYEDGTPVRDRLPRGAEGGASAWSANDADADAMPGSRAYRKEEAMRRMREIMDGTVDRGGVPPFEGVRDFNQMASTIQYGSDGVISMIPQPTQLTKMHELVAGMDPDLRAEMYGPGKGPIEIVNELMGQRVNLSAVQNESMMASAELNLKKREADRLDEELVYRKQALDQQMVTDRLRYGGPDSRQVLDVEKMLNDMEMNGQLDPTDDLVAQGMEDPAFEGMSEEGVRRALQIQMRGAKEQQLYGRLGMGQGGPQGGAEGPVAPEAAAAPPPVDAIGQRWEGVRQGQEAGSYGKLPIGEGEETKFNVSSFDENSMAALGVKTEKEEQAYLKDPLKFAGERLPGVEFQAFAKDIIRERLQTDLAEHWNAVVSQSKGDAPLKAASLDKLKREMWNKMRNILYLRGDSNRDYGDRSTGIKLGMGRPSKTFFMETLDELLSDLLSGEGALSGPGLDQSFASIGCSKSPT